MTIGSKQDGPPPSERFEAFRSETRQEFRWFRQCNKSFGGLGDATESLDDFRYLKACFGNAKCFTALPTYALPTYASPSLSNKSLRLSLVLLRDCSALQFAIRL